MYITSVQLQNIKSYADACIPFMPGTNAICGLNGSGKTTLLEAIGLALFDFLPYKHERFVREGERTGTVRVRVVALDDREYEVVRQIGAKSQHYVFDVALNEKIVERSPNVLDWVRANLLDIEGSADLRFLFQNAIGVPQGAITTEFLLSPAQRKTTFDRLLGVDEYHQAWERLRETATYVRDRMHRLEEDIAGLEGEIRRIPELETAIAENQRVLTEAETALESAREQQAIAESRRTDLDELERALQEAAHAIALHQQEQQQCSERLAKAREEEWQAQEARAIVEQTQAGHEAYEAARRALEGLEPERQERDRLKEKLANCQSGLLAQTAMLDSIVKQIEEAIAAQEAAQTLWPQVETQAKLEAELQHAREARQQSIRIRDEIDRLQQQKEQTRKKLEKLRGEIAEREQLRATLPDIPALEGQLVELRSRYREAIEAGKALSALEEQRAQLESELASREEQAEQLRSDIARLKTTEALAVCVPEREAAVYAARDEQQRLELAIQYQQLAREQLLVRQCPLLAIQCPAAKDQGWVASRFDEELSRLQTDYERAAARLTESEEALRVAKAAADEARSLEIKANDLHHLEAALTDLRSRLEALGVQQHQYTELAIATESIRQEGERVAALLDEAREQEKRIAQLAVLERQCADCEEQCMDISRDIARRSEELQPLLSEAAREAEIAAQLELLGDARGQYQQLQGKAQGRADLEKARAQHEEQRRKLVAEEATLKTRLETYAELDERIARQRALLREHEPAHNQYVRYKCTADLLEERQVAAEEAQRALEHATGKLERARAEHARLSAQYDVDEHEHMRSLCQDLIGRISMLNERVANVTSELRQREEELASLQRRAEQLRKAQSERASLEQTRRDIDCIRELIKAAAPALTESLLLSISHTADEIFCDIMDDYASELRWERDYEIVVQRGAEQRYFAQLSGGEQMSAALAVRLALIKQVSSVDVAFFDEPTQNMDAMRRTNLAAQIENVRGFQQLLVISHDDSFEEHTDHVVRLVKVHDQTVVESNDSTL
jgi:exonuclease SbcC